MNPPHTTRIFLVLALSIFLCLMTVCRSTPSHTGAPPTSGEQTEQPTPPGEGDPAPDFRAPDHNGNPWTLSDAGNENPVVLYFYPAAMTSGCTKQACTFRDRMASLNDLNATVIGISGDEVRNLRLFRKTHNLQFTLLSDPDGSVARKYGVPVGKGGTIKRTIDGQTFSLKREATFERWTFIIDRNGRIVYRDTDVSPTSDPENVIQALQNLQSSS